MYDALCGDGTLWADADQRQAAVRLEGLRWELAAYGRRLQAYAAELKEWQEATAAAQREQNGTGALIDGQGAGAVKGRVASISNSDSLWKRALGRQPLVQQDAHEEGVDVVSAHPAAASAPLRPEPPSGLFIHGSVGTGKTMLMDLFVEAVAADFRSPNRSTVCGFLSALPVTTQSQSQLQPQPQPQPTTTHQASAPFPLQALFLWSFTFFAVARTDAKPASSPVSAAPARRLYPWTRAPRPLSVLYDRVPQTAARSQHGGKRGSLPGG